MKFFFIFLIYSLIFISCAEKQHEEIGFNISGIETRISRVLINRNTFEGAVIKLLGRVKDLNISENEKPDNSIIEFKITDPKGNYINVMGTGIIELNEDDVIILGGQYSSPTNTIKLSEFEIIKHADS